MANFLMTDHDIELLIADDELMWQIFEAAQADRESGKNIGNWQRVGDKIATLLHRPIAPDVVKNAAKILMQAQFITKQNETFGKTT